MAQPKCFLTRMRIHSYGYICCGALLRLCTTGCLGWAWIDCSHKAVWTCRVSLVHAGLAALGVTPIACMCVLDLAAECCAWGDSSGGVVHFCFVRAYAGSRRSRDHYKQLLLCTCSEYVARPAHWLKSAQFQPLVGSCFLFCLCKHLLRGPRPMWTPVLAT